MIRTSKRYGWKADLPDHRDFKFKIEKPLSTLPSKVDLRSKFPSCYDQDQLGCHDSETQVLTDEGWKLFSDLSGIEKLATVNPETQELFYEKPTQLFIFDYIGDMICGKHQNIDFKVTPNHKMLVKKWNESKRSLNNSYELLEAKDLGWYVGLLNRIKWNGCLGNFEEYTLPGINCKLKIQRENRSVPLKAWLRFLGIYLAEGTLLKEENKIQLAAVKNREKEFIKSILNDLNINALELKDRFIFQNKQIYTELVRLGLKDKKAPQKFVPRFIFMLSADNIKEFLLGHFMGDGCQGKNRSHYTSSRYLADDLQTLVFLSGQESYLAVRPARSSMLADGRIIVGNYPEHRVSVNEVKNLSIERKQHIYIKNFIKEKFIALKFLHIIR